MVTLDVDRAHGRRRRRPTPRTARGDELRPAARPADHDQGRHRDGGHPLDRRRRRADRPRAGRATRRPSPGSRRPAPSSSARPTCRAGRATSRATTRSSARPTTRGTSTRVPGGSSGGPAAAVAGGLTTFELGTDIGGSVRMPSHCCGMFGLKPSYGVVPQRGYLDSVGGGTTDADINVFGPMARSADDLELLLAVLAGPDAGARAGVARRAAAGARPTSLRGRRVGRLVRRRRAYPIDRRRLEVLRRAVDAVADAGAQVEEAHPPVDLAAQIELFNGLDQLRRVARARTRSPRRSPARTSRGCSAEQRAGRVRRPRGPSGSTAYDALLCPVLPHAGVPARPGGRLLHPRRSIVNGERASVPRLIWWTGLIGVVGAAGRGPAGRPHRRRAAGRHPGRHAVPARPRRRPARRADRRASPAATSVPPGC